MIVDIVILTTTSLANALIGAIVYFRNPRAKTSQIFLILCLSVVAWITSNFFTDYAPSIIASKWFARSATTAGIWVFYWLFIFSLHFGEQNRPKRWFTVIYGIVLAAITGLALSPLVVQGTIRHPSRADVVVGTAYWLYIGILITLFIGSVRNFLVTKKKTTSLIATQIKFMLAGIVASIVLALLTNAIIPVFIDNWVIAKIGPVLTIFFTGTVAYAIVKYRLFDIRFVIARLIAYVLVVAVLGLTYGIVVFQFIDQLFPYTQTSITQQATYTVLAVFLGFTFQPLKKFFDRLTDRIFYRNGYSTSELISKVTAIASETLDLNKLSDGVLETLVNQVHIENGAIFLNDNGHFELLAKRGANSLIMPDLQYVEMMTRTGKMLIAESEEQNPFSDKLHQLNIAIVLPLVNKNNTQGVLMLGEKRSGEIYTDQDLKVLEILGPELAVAVGNARSYKQISEFNLTLKQEINKATSELRQANEQLHQKNQQLEQLDKLKDEFISVTSHELRTPLTAIRGYLWMAMHGRRRDQNYRLYMDRAYQSSERLIDLVNDTLDISRIESGRIELEPAPSDLINLTDEVIAELGSRASERQQHLSARHTNLPPVHCDANKIRQVLTNLIGNALKFTPKQGTIEVTFTLQNNMVITKIYDSGPSLTSEEQSKLFQKFSRLETTLATTPGTGLGLYLCKQIVELSGGKIWIESQAGQGTSFLFSLPIEKDPGATVTAPANTSVPLASTSMLTHS